MGLDMTLQCRKNIYGMYDFIGADNGTIDIYKDGEKLDIPFEKIHYIILECASWRKAYHIHRWFVQNVQEDDDDCGEYFVPIEKLKELLETCKTVYKEKNHVLSDAILPKKNSDFVGNTEYDEYYYNEVKYTIEILEEIIKKHNPKVDNYIYSSSW
jgi:hypothetical protein